MRIENPDVYGLGCNMNTQFMSIAPGKTTGGLPNIPDYRMKPLVDQVAACGPDILLCKNDSVQLGAPDTSGTLTFQWWPSTGLSDPTAAQPWASPSTSITYHLMVVDTTVHSSCDNTIDSVRVTIVSPLLPRPVAFAGNDTVVCAGVPLLLGMADSSGGAWAYAWSPPSFLNDPSVSNPTASLNASQQYILTAYRPEVVGSCQTDRDTVAVTMYDPSVLPVNPAGPDVVICIGDTVALGVASSGFTYDWTGANLSSLQVAQPLAWPVVGGIAIVSVTDNAVVGPCGTIRDTVGITVEQPFVHDAPLDVAFCVGECFQIGVPAASSDYLYTWTPAAGLENPMASLTKAQPTATTTYTLTVTNPAMQSANCRERRFNVTATADGCDHQSFIAVNGDNVAELLDLGDHAGSVSVKVFDMAGKLVFFSNDYQNDWSATMLAHGLYVYRVEVGGDCPSSFVGKIAVMK